MDLEEVYLRQIDQKLKRQNELQEENNELLKELLKALSKQGDNIMHKILAAAFILALTACYPVHAEKYTVDDLIKIITKGKILASNLNYSPSDSWNAPEERHFNLLVLYNKKLFICFVMDTKDFIVPDCKGTV